MTDTDSKSDNKESKWISIIIINIATFVLLYFSIAQLGLLIAFAFGGHYYKKKLCWSGFIFTLTWIFFGFFQMIVLIGLVYAHLTILIEYNYVDILDNLNKKLMNIYYKLMEHESFNKFNELVKLSHSNVLSILNKPVVKNTTDFIILHISNIFGKNNSNSSTENPKNKDK